MADYNVYIHSLGGTNEETPTKAWTTAQQGNPQTTAWGSLDEGTFSSGISAFKNEVSDTVISGTNFTLLKSAPVVAAATAVLNLSVKVNEGIMTFMSRETGNFHIQTRYNNLKATLNAGLHPIQTWINHIKSNQETRLYNYRQQQEQLLIGESFVNNSTRKV